MYRYNIEIQLEQMIGGEWNAKFLRRNDQLVCLKVKASVRLNS